MDGDSIYGLIKSRSDAARPDCRPADARSLEWDEILKPCPDAENSTGFLMTPALVVNGTVKHHGSVPSREEIRAWVLG